MLFASQAISFRASLNRWLSQTRPKGQDGAVVRQPNPVALGQRLSAVLLGAVIFSTAFNGQAAIAASSSPSQSGIQQAERASEQVFEGLETTQELVGKRPSRNKAIAHGRDRASAKLEGLAQKAKSEPESLNDSEHKALKQLSSQR